MKCSEEKMRVEEVREEWRRGEVSDKRSQGGESGADVRREEGKNRREEQLERRGEQRSQKRREEERRQVERIK